VFELSKQPFQVRLGFPELGLGHRFLAGGLKTDMTKQQVGKLVQARDQTHILVTATPRKDEIDISQREADAADRDWHRGHVEDKLFSSATVDQAAEVLEREYCSRGWYGTIFRWMTAASPGGSWKRGVTYG
jgi:hypothetical protein